VRRYSRPLFAFFGILAAVFFVTGLASRPLYGLALMNYVVIWSIVIFFGPWCDVNAYRTAFWVSLNTGRPGFAMRKHLWQKFSFAGLYLQVFLNRNKLGNIPSGSFEETCVVLILAACLLLGLFFYKMGWTRVDPALEKKALKYLRAIAAEPVPELNDPRLKGWDQKKPLFFEETVEISERLGRSGFSSAEYDHEQFRPRRG
jgi:hypothetical protein